MKERGQIHAPLALHMGKDNFLIDESKTGRVGGTRAGIHALKKEKNLIPLPGTESWSLACPPEPSHYTHYDAGCVFQTGMLNLQTPYVNYSWSTAPLTSEVAFYIFIQQI